MILNENPADNVLRAALAGNDPAAGLLWDRYARDLLAFLEAILCSLHDAEDVLQMVYVQRWRDGKIYEESLYVIQERQVINVQQ